jgi:preprotein translocase subunit SecG
MDFFDVLLLIVSVLLIVVVLMQSSKDDISDAFSGSKSELFKNQKSRGLEAVLQKATWVLGIIFIALAIVCTII